MDIMFDKLFAQLLFWLYDFLDAIFETFQVLAGITPVNIDGGEISLINVFLTHSTVTQVFLSIFLLAIIVAAICAIAKVVATVINLKGGERKSHVKTVGQALAVIPATLVMAAVLVMFIFVSNSMLQFVQKSFNSSYENLTFSQMLFDMSVESSYQYNYSKPKYVPIYVLDAAGQKIPVIDEVTGEQKKDENDELVWKIQCDEQGNPMYDEIYDVLREDENDPNSKPVLSSGWQVRSAPANPNEDPEYWRAADLDFSTMKPDKVFGVHKKILGLVEDGSKPYTQNAMVDLGSFNLFSAYLVVVIMLVVIIWSMLGLVKRIFDLTFLFLALPLVTATIPLDDGAKFKTWRDTVVSKVILAFGIIFSINIFLLMLPIIDQIDFVALDWSAGVTTVFKIFLMLGGALSINGGQLLAARLVGADASESREMTQAARALLGGGMAAGGMLRGAKNAVLGGQNKNGGMVGGMLPTAAKLSGGVANAVGNVMGGTAFKSGVNKSKAAVGNVANALRGITKTTMPGSTNDSAAGGQNATAATEKKPGLFHNGILGALSGSADKHKTKTPLGSHLIAPLGNSPTTPPNVINQQSGGSTQGYEKPADKTGVDDMVSKLGVMPKDGESGAMKKPLTPKK